MEIELHKGDVFACQDPECQIEVEVKKGGQCRGLACCSREMVRTYSAAETLDGYEEDMRSQCDQDGG